VGNQEVNLQLIDDNQYTVEDFKGKDFKNFSTLEWFQFCKANKAFGEPGIAADELRALNEGCEKQIGHRPATIVETGMCFGVTTRYFIIRNLKYGGELNTFEVWIRDGFKKSMENVGLWDKINVHGHSIKSPWDKDIDILFIDSEHALSDALGEYIRFRPYIKAETLIGFHDTDCCPGVKRAIEIIQEIDVLELVSESTNKAAAGIKFYRRTGTNRADLPWNKGDK